MNFPVLCAGSPVRGIEVDGVTYFLSIREVCHEERNEHQDIGWHGQAESSELAHEARNVHAGR